MVASSPLLFFLTLIPPYTLAGAAAPARLEQLLSLAPAEGPRGSSTVRPLVSMRWMTRWSSTIFCFARSRMSSSTLPLVRNLPHSERVR